MKKQLLFFLLMFVSVQGFSQWSLDPTINTKVNSGVNQYFNPKTIADGAGGIISVFDESVYDSGLSTNISSLFVQRLSASGNAVWPIGGVEISTTPNNIIDKIITSDGSGGIVIVWIEETVAGSYQSRIFAQRVDNTGNRMWGNTGVEIMATEADYELADLVRDAAGDYILSYANVDLEAGFAQKLNSSGAPQWGTGLLLPETAGVHYAPKIYLETGGYLFLWVEEYEVSNEFGAIYYWQRVNTDGTKNGGNVTLFNFAPSAVQHYIESAVPDGTGGFYVGIVETDDVTASLYLQHVLSDNTKTFSNTPYGILVDASIGKPASSWIDFGVALESDGANGVVIGWTDTRSGNDGLYAQRFNASGTKLWGSSDLTLAPGFVSSNFYHGSIKTNTDGDFVFLFNRVQTGSISHLYVQKASPAGNLLYGTSGVLAAGRDVYKGNQEMVVSGNKVVLTWHAFNETESQTNVYAQSVFSSGVLPVKFAGFNAVYQSGKTKLTWTTASETNNAYFEVERSEDAVNFVAIGRENGAGDSNELKNYAYTDVDAFAAGAFLYYRIKQVDKNGEFDYTEVKSVKVPTLAPLIVKSYPNPMVNKLSINLGNDTSAATYLLSDISGKTILKGSFNTAYEVNVAQLPRGVYILNVQSGSQKHQEKIIKN
jgi:hypothetical protein